MYTVDHKNVPLLFFYDSVDKDAPISVILLLLQSIMNCRGRWCLLKSVAALPCEICSVATVLR